MELPSRIASTVVSMIVADLHTSTMSLSKIIFCMMHVVTIYKTESNTIQLQSRHYVRDQGESSIILQEARMGRKESRLLCGEVCFKITPLSSHLFWTAKTRSRNIYLKHLSSHSSSFIHLTLFFIIIIYVLCNQTNTLSQITSYLQETPGRWQQGIHNRSSFSSFSCNCTEVMVEKMHINSSEDRF